MTAPQPCDVADANSGITRDPNDSRALDRVLGTIFGCALGDALGLPAEGGEKSILAERYPKGLCLPHANPCRGFPQNDWTDDTDLTVLLMRSLSAYQRGEVTDLSCDFAMRLRSWFDTGFVELGDSGGAGCGNMIWRVLRREEFTTDPFHAAREAIGPKAGNGAVMRTSPCAFAEDPVACAEYCCAVTHSDSRCIASCIVQCQLIRSLVDLPSDGRAGPEILQKAIESARHVLSEVHYRELIKWAHRSASLDMLDIGATDARGYTFKTLGCSMWAFRRILRNKVRDAAFFKKHMTALVMEAGDADTNAAVAGAVLGAAMGYAALPQDWITVLPNKDWLEAEVRKWYATFRN